MPTRSSPGSSQSTWTVVQTRKNGSKLETSNAVTNLSWIDSVTFGDNLKGWRDLLRKGENATTGMAGERSIVRVTNGLLDASEPPEGKAATHNIRAVVTGTLRCQPQFSATNPSSIDDAKANAEALGRFNQRIIAVHQAFQGGVFLGELGQTLRMIKNPAQGLRRLADDFHDVGRRLRGARGFGSLKQRLKTISENLADAWLEAQFGWRPLMSDINSASEALAEYDKGQGFSTKRISAKGTASEAIIRPKLITTSYHPLKWVVEEVDDDSCIVVYRGAMRVEARDPRTMDPRLAGFDLASWLPTAWELVPYSFLIDYFSNIGDIVYGWSTLGTRLTWCNRTVIRTAKKTKTTVCNIKMCRDVEPDVNSVSHVPAKVVTEKTSVSRSTYTGTFVPDITFEVPGSGSLKWLNIAALIASRDGDRRWSYD